MRTLYQKAFVCGVLIIAGLATLTATLGTLGQAALFMTGVAAGFTLADIWKEVIREKREVSEKALTVTFYTPSGRKRGSVVADEPLSSRENQL